MGFRESFNNLGLIVGSFIKQDTLNCALSSPLDLVCYFRDDLKYDPKIHTEISSLTLSLYKSKAHTFPGSFRAIRHFLTL